jgi:hypothetical protein
MCVAELYRRKGRTTRVLLSFIERGITLADPRA